MSVTKVVASGKEAVVEDAVSTSWALNDATAFFVRVVAYGQRSRDCISITKYV